MLLNGIVCLIIAMYLLRQIVKSEGLDESSPYFKKFVLIFWGMLMVLSIHNIFSVYEESWIKTLLFSMDSLINLLFPISGIFLGLSLSSKRKRTASYEPQ